MTKEKSAAKKAYRKPTVAKTEQSRVCSWICGWDLCCGVQVRKDK